jgi:tetratricopeptide (TPR) repeat protein
VREATDCLESVVDLATQTAQPAFAGNAYHQLAMTARVMGDLERSRLLAEKSRAAGALWARQAPDASSEIANLWPQITGAFLDIHHGRVDEAETRLQRVITVLAARPAFHNYRNAAQIGLGAAAVARGRLPEAVAWLEPAASDPGNRFPFTHVRALLLLARIADAQGRADLSAGYLRRALYFAGRRSLLDEYVQAALALMDLRPAGSPVTDLVGSVLAYIRSISMTAAERRLETALDSYMNHTAG